MATRKNPQHKGVTSVTPQAAPAPQPSATPQLTPLVVMTDTTLDLWQGRATEFLARFAQLKAAFVFKQLIQIGGYTFKIDEAALEKALTQLGGPKPVSKGSLLAHASEIVRTVKIDRDDATDEGLLYADAVERSRTLYAGYSVSIAHPSTNYPVKGIVPGVFAVMGETRSGKTTYVREVAKTDLIIRASEPFESIDMDLNVVTVRTYPQALGLLVICALAQTRVALDSLRFLVFNLKGTTGEGGVSNALYELLTTLNNLVAELGAVVLVTVNPMVGDDEKVMRLLSRFDASVAAVVFLSEGKVTYGSVRTTSGRHLMNLKDGAVVGSDLPIFSTSLPGNGTDLMVNVDALGGDSPRAISSRMTGADKKGENPSAVRTFPVLPFDSL